MSFFIYDITFLVVFGLFIFIFLYTRRKNLKREGIAFLYRTQLGVKIIDYIGRKYGKFLRVLSYFVIAFGYLAMFAMLYLLYQTVIIFFKFPEFIRAIKIPPLAPLIPYLPQLFKADYLPVFYFTYWIVVLAIVAIVHEFSHGIFARLANIRIKSTGFAFFGPFIGAFVEPDEKQMKNARKKDQLAILAAGTFSNAVLTVLFFFIFWLFFSLAYAPSGVMFNTYTYDFVSKNNITSIGENIQINFDGGLNLTEVKAGNKTYFMPTESLEKIDSINVSQQIYVYADTPALKAGLKGVIIKINGYRVNNNEALKKELLKYQPGDKITITMFDIENKNNRDYEIILAENPKNKSIPYIGITMVTQQGSIIGKVKSTLMFFRDPNTYYAPKFTPDFIEFIYYLLWWITFINFSVALANMLPAWIFDGGRFFYITILAIVKKEKIAKKIMKISNYIILLTFLLLMVLWAFAFL